MRHLSVSAAGLHPIKAEECDQPTCQWTHCGCFGRCDGQRCARCAASAAAVGCSCICGDRGFNPTPPHTCRQGQPVASPSAATHPNAETSGRAQAPTQRPGMAAPPPPLQQQLAEVQARVAVGKRRLNEAQAELLAARRRVQQVQKDLDADIALLDTLLARAGSAPAAAPPPPATGGRGPRSVCMHALGSRSDLTVSIAMPCHTPAGPPAPQLQALFPPVAAAPAGGPLVPLPPPPKASCIEALLPPGIPVATFHASGPALSVAAQQFVPRAVQMAPPPAGAAAAYQGAAPAAPRAAAGGPPPGFEPPPAAAQQQQQAPAAPVPAPVPPQPASGGVEQPAPPAAQQPAPAVPALVRLGCCLPVLYCFHALLGCPPCELSVPPHLHCLLHPPPCSPHSPRSQCPGASRSRRRRHPQSWRRWQALSRQRQPPWWPMAWTLRMA